MKIDSHAARRHADFAAFPARVYSRRASIRSNHRQTQRVSLAPASNVAAPTESGRLGICLDCPEPPLIYAVDDLTRLTELYTDILEGKGYLVKTFNHRAVALASLHAETRRPALLITDYIGVSMSINRFLLACRVIEPRLRILMASGLEQTEMRFSGPRPDRFLEKPFTPAEFVQAIEAS